MGTSFAADPMGWLQKRAVLIIAALALIVLAAVVWKERSTATPPAPSPATVAGTAVPKQWAQVPGLFDGRINALAIEDPGGMVILYAGTEGGVFKSWDRGTTWIPCNNGLSNRLVRALALDPDDPNVLYAGTWNGKVHLSTDAAASWQERSVGLPPFEIRALAVHTHDPHKLYAGTPAGIYTTTDRGLNWHAAAFLTGTVQCMAMNPDHPDRLYVGTAENGIYKTLDGGATWFQLPATFADVTSLVIPPRATRTVYALSGGKVYKTENAGIYWEYADSYRDRAVATCLAVDPKNAQVVYVGLQDGLHKSKDARQSWAQSDAGLKKEDRKTEVRVIAVDPIDSDILFTYAVTHTLATAETGQTAAGGHRGNGEFFISTNAGETWQQRSMVPAQDEANILALELDPKDGRTFYASVAGGGLYKTTDKGDNWEHVGEPLPAAWITAVAVDAVNTRRVYVGIWEGFVFKSSDGGETWAPAGSVSEAQISDLAVDPEQPERIYAGTLGEGLFRSDDEGWQWTYKGDDIGKKVQRIVVDPRGPQTTVYVLTENGVFRSHDAGESWESYLFSVADIAPSIKGGLFQPVVVPRADPGYVTGMGLEGAIVVRPQQMVPGVELKGLMVSPAIPTDFYVLAEGQGVIRFTNSGTRQTPLGPGLEGLELRALALSPDDSNLILVGTDRGIYRYQPSDE